MLRRMRCEVRLYRGASRVHPVSAMCELLEVSRSGYHAWRGRGPSTRERQNTRFAHARSVPFTPRTKETTAAPGCTGICASRESW